MHAWWPGRIWLVEQGWRAWPNDRNVPVSLPLRGRTCGSPRSLCSGALQPWCSERQLVQRQMDGQVDRPFRRLHRFSVYPGSYRSPTVSAQARAVLACGHQDRSKGVISVDMDAFMAFVGKFAGDLGAVVAAGNVVVGDRLGLYRGLAAGGPSTAAASFARAGQAGEAAADRLAVAVHLRGAARYAEALATLNLLLPEARASDRARPCAAGRGAARQRAGPARARPGEGSPGRPGRARLGAAARGARGRGGAAAAPRRRHGARRRLRRAPRPLTGPPTCTATRTARTRSGSCAGRAPRRCLFTRGEWDLAVGRVRRRPGRAGHARRIRVRSAPACLGLILALRGAAADARTALAEASEPVRAGSSSSRSSCFPAGGSP